MVKKYFFFDIDGTLTNHNPGGIILPSTHEALRKLKENGHFVAIATGRAECMAREFAEECQITNMVHDGGNGLTVDGKIIYIKPLDHEKALKILHECVAKDIPVCVAVDNTLQRYSHNDALSKKNPDMKGFFNIQVIKNLNYDHFKEIHKIFIGLYPGEEDRLESVNELGYSRYHDNHIIIEPDDKVRGIKDMMHYLHASFDDVVVFGDGHNDLTMIKAAPISIAMGNAIDELKAAATYVTQRCDEDGIMHACRHFGWID